LEKLYIIRKGKPISFELPAGFRLLSFAAFPEHGHVRDPRALSRQSLRNPIGSPALASCLSSGQRVAILVEDVIRSSPKGFILEALLQELRGIGIPESRISVVTQDIPRRKGEMMGFIHAQTLQEAFECVSSFLTKPEVHVIPSGGVILPLFGAGFHG
jgi:hypothetical protein